MKKMIFLDIDGTLVLPHGSISPLVKEGLTKARENGHEVYLCTGRNYAAIQSLLSFDFDGYICSAGNYVVVKGEKLNEHYLSNEEVKQVREIFSKNHVLYNLEAKDDNYLDLEMVYALNVPVDDPSLLSGYQKSFHQKPIKEYDQNPVPIHKISFVAKEIEDLEEPKKLLSSKYQFVVHDLFSTNDIIGEIIEKGMDKGKAIKMVVSHLNRSLEDTIGFGDSMNDYEMIKTCHIGVAMANASKELKQYADVICESVNDDGIYHQLKRLQII